MNLLAAISLTAGLVGIILFINGFEFLFMTRSRLFYNVWTFENLKAELQTQIPLPKVLTGFIFSDRSFKYLPTLQMCLTILMLYKISLWTVIALLVVHLITCIRFRGTFNGGSDMMIVVVLTGLIISLINPGWQKAGMIYVAIHTLFSYFKAGFVKIKSREWRQGSALKTFLERSPFELIRTIASELKERPLLNLSLCWLVIFFELSVVFLVLFPQLKIIYLIGALIFHLMIGFGFGLNRFFWAWLSAWPAVFFTLSLYK